MRNSLTIYTPVVALYVMMKRGPYKRYYREADPITSMPKRTLYDLRRINREVITNMLLNVLITVGIINYHCQYNYLCHCMQVEFNIKY